MTTERTGTFALILAGIVVLILAFSVSRLSMQRQINGDEAYNLQIAKSIGLNFCYCTRYRPERVFPVEESTNGVIQYIGGIFFALTHSPDRVKAGTTTAATLFLGAVLLALEPWLALLSALLFLLWPTFVYVSINFFGEIWAIAFSLLGMNALRKCDFAAPFQMLLRNRAVIYASLFFGLAIESKLVAALAIFPVAWAIAYQGCERATSARASRACSITAMVGLGALLTLLGLVAFSVTHSTRSMNAVAIWQTFTGYISNMFSQGQGQAQPLNLTHAANIISQFDSPVILALFIMSGAILLYVHWTYLFFLIVTLAWWLHYGANERHALISLYVTIIWAGLQMHALVQRIMLKHKMSGAKLPLGASAMLAAMVLLVGIATHSNLNAPGAIAFYPNREHLVRTSQGRYHYSNELVAALRFQRYVAASGWWQFAELTLREDLEFYDRMSPANANLPREQTALLFDKGNKNWPLTSIQGNCERVLHTEGPIVLCTVKRAVPLDFQPTS